LKDELIVLENIKTVSKKCAKAIKTRFFFTIIQFTVFFKKIKYSLCENIKRLLSKTKKKEKRKEILQTLNF